MRPWLTAFALALLIWGNVSGHWNEKVVLLWAEYRPGGTCDDCFGWRVTILNGGLVEMEVKASPGPNAPDEWIGRPASLLSKRQLQRIAQKITEVHWGELKPEYSATYQLSEDTGQVVTDQETVVIKARVGPELKRVEIYGPAEVAGIEVTNPVHPAQEAGRRFCSVWAEVLDIVGSPNTWQRPRLYR